VSRRVILEAERETKRETLVKELLVGQVREGIVKNITDFGAFIDLGGLDGLLHITDMSWGRVGHPSEVVDIGAALDIKVLDIDWNRERISLGLKQLLPYPWTDIDKKYPVGSRVRGKVVSITNYGAFVELEKGVEGLVHISEMSWTRNVRHPSKVVSIGEEIEAVVTGVLHFGAFVNLAGGLADALLPVQELPDDYYDHDDKSHALLGRHSGFSIKLGQTLTVRLREADPISGRLRVDYISGGTTGRPVRRAGFAGSGRGFRRGRRR